MGNRLGLIAAAVAMLLAPAPSLARESLGIFSSWGAFRDEGVPRCYAIAQPAPGAARKDHQPFATVATWPRRAVRNQVHLRLSRNLAERPAIQLRIGGQRFDLAGSGANAWARDKAMDAAIVSAMRSTSTMRVSASDSRGRRFSDSYALDGAATAMDAAMLACSGRTR